MLKLKICGLKDPHNIQEVIALKPDMIGFIFYEGSQRNVCKNTFSVSIPDHIQKVGVFVDAKPSFIELEINRFGLRAIQLYHKDILPFQYLRDQVKIIKAISIRTFEDIENIKEYDSLCDHFLFDTKGEKAGGNGVKFDWRIINSYKGKTPFLLSGGIGPEDAESIKQIGHEKLVGIDINSKFEIEPGIKNIKGIRKFKKELYENIEYNQ